MPLQEKEAGERPLTIAIPQLDSYHSHTGIGRVFHSLCAAWGERVRVVEAAVERVDVPVLRNFPSALRPPPAADVVVLPRLTGARALRRTAQVPSLVIVHDVGVVDFPGDRAGMDLLTYAALLSSFRSLRYADRIVAVSAFCRERLLAHLPGLEEKISVVPDGVGAAFLGYRSGRAEARARAGQWLDRPLDGPLLLNVGSELPRKNLPLLLRAFRRVKQQRPDALLIKVGAPGHPRWRERTLAALRELGLRPGHDVLLLDRLVDDERLADLYGAADLFVSPSLYEGFGLPALEALAVGTPVVTVRNGAAPEVVGDAGRMVPAEVGPLVAAIEATLASPADPAARARGRERAAGLTWERAAGQYLGLLASLRRAAHPALAR